MEIEVVDSDFEKIDNSKFIENELTMELSDEERKQIETRNDELLLLADLTENLNEFKKNKMQDWMAKSLNEFLKKYKVEVEYPEQKTSLTKLIPNFKSLSGILQKHWNLKNKSYNNEYVANLINSILFP